MIRIHAHATKSKKKTYWYKARATRGCDTYGLRLGWGQGQGQDLRYGCAQYFSVDKNNCAVNGYPYRIISNDVSTSFYCLYRTLYVYIYSSECMVVRANICVRVVLSTSLSIKTIVLLTGYSYRVIRNDVSAPFYCLYKMLCVFR